MNAYVGLAITLSLWAALVSIIVWAVKATLRDRRLERQEREQAIEDLIKETSK